MHLYEYYLNSVHTYLQKCNLHQCSYQMHITDPLNLLWYFMLVHDSGVNVLNPLSDGSPFTVVYNINP